MVQWELNGVQPDKIASLIANGAIIGRCVGRMEWGARALGNRSILANPSDLRVISKINRAIKQRDFWMPFAPSVLAERAQCYFEQYGKVEAKYMNLGFHTTAVGGEVLAACCHSFDLTCRPQVVKEEDNPEYYAIIKNYEKITGVGALLNTSLNIHGDPIVCSANDALDTFLRSNLDYLVINDFLIYRK